MPHFARYFGIDYSGAETADSSCKGIRVFMAEGSGEPAQVQPPPSPRRYWTRRGLAEWLREELDRDIPTLVGIDYAFSFVSLRARPYFCRFFEDAVRAS